MKLVLEEQGSDAATTFYGRASELCAASIGYVEARSALGAALRAGRLPARRGDDARVGLESIWQEVHVVDLDDEVVVRAGDVAELLRLRAGDAIHLASALALADPELVFVSWDEELARAAREVGLAVAP